MAISVHTGVPGSGKSHALVKDIVVPGVQNGRRILTNIDGLNPDAVFGYCAERTDDASKLGEVVIFDGEDAKKPGFWPTESIPDTDTVVKAGDIVVFDEWRLYFGSRGKGWGPDDLVKFLRWHRHLTHEKGYATDVHIATQLPTDLHPDIRGLCASSYKYQKLSALGLGSAYSWKVWQGHLQPKGGHYQNGTGKYDPEIFPLYKSSSAAAGTHTELKTNRRESIWSQPKVWAFLAAFPIVGIGAIWGLSHALDNVPGSKPPEDLEASVNAPAGTSPANHVPAQPAKSEWRIVGHLDDGSGVRVIVADASGGVRILRGDDFQFDEGRPVSGFVDGKLAVAEDRAFSSGSTSPFKGVLQ